MKKTLLFLILLLINLITKSQVIFCPPGAEWHYVFWENNLDPTPEFKNEMVKYTGDSVVSGDTVKILKHLKFFKDINFPTGYTTLIKQNGDTVFMKSGVTNNQWQILFNYAALPGHSWKIALPYYNLSYTVTVDSVNTVSMNGFNLKRLSATYKQSNSITYSALIIERIGGGGSAFLFNFYGNLSSDGDYLADFLCYQDNSFGLKQFTTKSCDYSLYVGIKEYSSKNRPFKIYPNPSQHELTIEIPSEKSNDNYNLHLTDISGKIILKEKHSAENGKLQLIIENLEKGFYFLQILYEGKIVASEKIIKD